MSSAQGGPPKVPPQVLAAMAKDPSLAPTVIGISIAFTGLALAAVSMRCFARLKLVKIFGVDDYFMLVAMVISIGHCVSQVIQGNNGAGRHLPLLTYEERTVFRKALYASILCYNCSLTFTRLSILLQYRRIFPIHSMRIAIHCVMVICACYGIEYLFTAVFTCVPVNAFWFMEKKRISFATCMDENILYYVNSAFGIACDLMVATLPLNAVWHLQIPKRQKIALAVLLSLGFFVCVASIARLEALIHLGKHRNDPSYNAVRASYWSAIEINLAMVCGSAPALKPLIVRLIPQFASRPKASSDGELPSFVKKMSGSGRRFQFGFPGEEKSATQVSNISMGTTRNRDTLTALPGVKNKEVKAHVNRTGYGYGKEDRPSESSSQRDLVEPYHHV